MSCLWNCGMFAVICNSWVEWNLRTFKIYSLSMQLLWDRIVFLASLCWIKFKGIFLADIQWDWANLLCWFFFSWCYSFSLFHVLENTLFLFPFHAFFFLPKLKEKNFLGSWLINPCLFTGQQLCWILEEYCYCCLSLHALGMCYKVDNLVICMHVLIYSLFWLVDIFFLIL